ncbi:MAG: HEAT repeat domain-containing protein [Candidatus Solibacter sp.]
MIAPLLAALVATMLDGVATVAQRNDACTALRGERAPEIVTALVTALPDPVVRACAARDLREAGAVPELIGALLSPDADSQMAAARELGELHDARALDALGRAALSSQTLVASSAIAALGAYPLADSLPYLLRAAQQANVAGMQALETAARSGDPAAVELARRVLARGDVAAQVVALSIIGDFGDASDLPRLRQLAAHSDPVYSRGRGFGFMPPIDVARAAQTTIARIAAR